MDQQHSNEREQLPNNRAVDMKLFTVTDAAQILSISPWTVRAYIRDGKLTPVRVGRLVRLDQQELENFISQAKVPAALPQSIEKGND
jgi:excisionase family DNA binding protein